MEQETTDAGAQSRYGFQWFRRLLSISLVLVFVSTGLILWQSRSPNGALLHALAEGDITSAESALQRGADPNLKVAFHWPSERISDRLSGLQYKMIQSRDYYDRPLLFHMAGSGKVAAVKLLLAHGADPNTLGPDGMTALKLAKNSGFSEIAGLLQKAGALK